MQRTLTLSLADCQAFAEMSGDRNPLHVDPLVARRSSFGRPVVHGVHLLMRALECAVADRTVNRLHRVSAVFRHPVTINQLVRLEITSSDLDHGFKGHLYANEVLSSSIDVHWSSAPRVSPQREQYGVTVSEPRILDYEQASTASGAMRPQCDVEQLRQLLPNAAAKLPISELAVLTTISTLVGMECPGRFSLLSRVSIEFDSLDKQPLLHYRVKSSQERFRQITLAVAGCDCQGEVIAFVRPEPRKQIRFADAVAQVTSDEFGGSVAVVVGGSRGLGEVAVKFLAAGGAHTFVGYASGKEDADRVVSELSNHGASARSVHLDVRAVDSSELWEILPDSSTIDLFYFATPPITPGPESGFSTDLYQQFSEFYVAGPATLMAALVHHGHRVRCLLCPSTVYVTNPPERMTEYAVAKTASEALCKILATKVSGLITYAPRWPRLPTDQTVSVISDDFADPAEVVLGSLRELYQLSTNSMYRTADTSVAGGEGS